MDKVGAHTASLMMVFRLLLCLQVEVVYYNICSECNNSNSEAGEHAGDHCAVGEYRVLAPGFTLGPGVPKERWWVRHLISAISIAKLCCAIHTDLPVCW